MAQGLKQGKPAANPQGTTGWDFKRALEVIGRYVRKEPGADQAEAERAIAYLALRPETAPKAARTKK
jgi:hypothetical protein